jgi:amidohydrolase
MPLPDPVLDRLIAFRKALHRHAELAGGERQTAQLVLDFMQGCRPDRVIAELGGHGLAFVFEGRAPGPTIVFRCEMDAVPVAEEGDLAHRSQDPRASHKCGHDGHMAVVAGLALGLARQRPARGRIVLLFQPAEETGAGAQKVLEDERFRSLRPDLVFALHNLPGHPFGQVLIKDGPFCCASRGMTVTLKGIASHAAYPEQGRSPALAMAQIIQELGRLPEQFRRFVLVTVVHARLGEPAFGTSPATAEIRATLRAAHNEDSEQLVEQAVHLVTQAAQAHDLDVEITWEDVFPAVVNDRDAVEVVKNAAERCGFSLLEPETAFRWSEDFARFTERYKGALCCIGAGIDHPPLHSPRYDFPDRLIDTGVAFFQQIISQLCG